MGKHACTVVHNLQKKKKASHGVYVHLQLTQPASISFHSVKLNWFHLVFATCLFPIQVHRVGGLACARQQGRKTIHHGDSKDKHIYTCINLGFFSPGPTRASPFFSLPSTFLRLSLHFISVICCTYIKWVVFYNNWFPPPPHLIENNVHSDWWMHLLLCNGVCNKRRIDPQRCSAAVYSIQSTIQQRGGQYRRASSIIFVLYYVQPVS